LIVKLLIIGVVLVGGIALIYPEETIQFSKGFTLQEKTEQNFIDLKDDTINQLGNGISETLHKVNNKIQDTINNLFDKT
jgi:hypothetical protein